MKLHNKNTGEDGRLMMCHDYDEYPLFVEIGCIKTYYHNFADMVKAGWDCIEIPVEPLIKDEKIRKAVRAWADANEFEPKYTVKYHSSCYDLSSWQGDIEFNSPIKGLEDEKEYTIAELCGEEE